MDTSLKPSTKATPVNEAVADIARTINQGDVPSNEQLNRAFDHTQGLVQAKKEEAPLTHTGKKIATDVQEVISSAQTLLNEKNADEKVQKIITESRAAGTEIGAEAQKQATLLSNEARGRLAPTGQKLAREGGAAAKDISKELSKEAQELLKAARDLVLELIRSREFRGLAIDLLDLLNDTLRSASQKMEEGLQTATQKLRETTEEASKKLKEAKGTVEREEEPDWEEVKEKGQQTYAEVAGVAKEKVEEVKKQARGKKKELAQTVEEYKQKAVEKGEELKEQAKEKAKQAYEEVRQGQVPSLIPLEPQQREKIRLRVNQLLSRLGENEHYKRAVGALFHLIDQLKAFANSAAAREEKLVDSAKSNPHLQEVWAQLQALVQEFAQGYCVDCLVNNTYSWLDMVQNDDQIRSFWRDMRGFINEALENPKIVVDEARTKRLDSLIDRAREIGNELRYSEATYDLTTQFRGLIDAIRTDPTTNQLVSSVQKLAADLFLDDGGHLTWKPDELNQFKILILSLVMEELKYIPIPLMRGSTKDYDFLFQNAHLYGYDLLPEHIQLKFESNIDLNLKEIQADKAYSRLLIKITNIKTHMRNAAFYFKKKTGLIKMTDQGLVDVDLAGDGLGIAIELVWDPKREGGAGFVVKTVKCGIDKLRVHVVDSRYDWLLNMVSPILAGDIRRSIEDEVERRIRFNVERAFMLVRRVADQIPIDTQRAKEIAVEQMRDVQATKNAIETA
jgi:hypothetical protein